MATIEIPVVDQQIDTDNPKESVTNVASGVLGVAGLFGIYAGAQYVYNEATDRAGVGDGSMEVPRA